MFVEQLTSRKEFHVYLSTVFSFIKNNFCIEFNSISRTLFNYLYFKIFLLKFRLEVYFLCSVLADFKNVRRVRYGGSINYSWVAIVLKSPLMFPINEPITPLAHGNSCYLVDWLYVQK
jgi:hypothetical protein